MPQSQQHGIWAMSETYTTAHGHTGSLTHWGRSEIKPTTSWFLVGFISTVTQWELPLYLLVGGILFEWLVQLWNLLAPLHACELSCEFSTGALLLKMVKFKSIVLFFFFYLAHTYTLIPFPSFSALFEII